MVHGSLKGSLAWSRDLLFPIWFLKLLGKEFSQTPPPKLSASTPWYAIIGRTYLGHLSLQNPTHKIAMVDKNCYKPTNHIAKPCINSGPSSLERYYCSLCMQVSSYTSFKNPSQTLNSYTSYSWISKFNDPKERQAKKHVVKQMVWLKLGMDIKHTY